LLPFIFPILPFAQEIGTSDYPNPYTVGRYLHSQAQPNDIILCVPDEDRRITSGRETCTLILNLYRDLAPNIYYLDQLADYEILQKFLNPKTGCTNEYLHMPHPEFKIDCVASINNHHAANIWLVLWRSREDTIQAALADPPHLLTRQRFEAADVIYVANQTGFANTFIQAGEIALAESKTPLRQFENYISLATIYMAARHVDRALATLDEAAFVSRWPQATEQLTQLQIRLSFLPLPLKPKTAANVVWNDEVVLIGVDQDLNSLQPTASSTIQISFYRQILRPISNRYQFLLHLVNDQGDSVAIYDHQPFDGGRPLTDWLPGQTVRETRMLSLPADLAPGTYRLVTGVYNPDTLERLPITAGPAGAEWALAEWVIR
jgi:hypothetical protein